MFGRKKIRKLEEEVTELKLSFGYLKDMLEAAQDVIKQNQRQGVEQAKAFDEKFIALKRKIAELEEKAKQTYDELNEKARATDKDRDSEKAVPMSQVMDEWLNGKKAGEN